MKIKVGIECGQSIWRAASWKMAPKRRRFSSGFAIGPVMFWRSK